MSALRSILLERVRRRGPMPFAAYMQTALYHPVHGYYSAQPPRTGRAGHFLTSPELDPAFGRLWAGAFEELWRACGAPERVDLVEIGPGEGAFAAAVLDAARGRFGQALRYTMVEPAPAAERRQRSLLSGDRRARWIASVTLLPDVAAGCVFANEVLDNLPVHVVEMRGGRLREVCVGERDGELVEVLLPATDPALRSYLRRCGLQLAEGRRAEVGLAAESFVSRCAAALGRGALVVVDYGDEAAALVRRPAGTLVAYSDSGVDADVLARPGERDITAHVNWTAVRAACARAGLAPAGPVAQREVLASLGLRELDAELRAAHHAAAAQGRGGEAVAALSRRQALGALSDPGGLGSLGVMTGLAGIALPSSMSPGRAGGPAVAGPPEGAGERLSP